MHVDVERASKRKGPHYLGRNIVNYRKSMKPNSALRSALHVLLANETEL